MSDETPTSGNRWETTGDDTTETPATTAPVVERRPLRDRVRPAIAGGIAGAAVVAGLGGFTVGRATADDGSDPGVDRQQQVGFFPDQDRDGDGDGDRGFPAGPGGGVPGGGVPGGPGGDQQMVPPGQDGGTSGSGDNT